LLYYLEDEYIIKGETDHDKRILTFNKGDISINERCSSRQWDFNTSYSPFNINDCMFEDNYEEAHNNKFISVSDRKRPRNSIDSPDGKDRQPSFYQATSSSIPQVPPVQSNSGFNYRRDYSSSNSNPQGTPLYASSSSGFNYRRDYCSSSSAPYIYQHDNNVACTAPNTNNNSSTTTTNNTNTTTHNNGPNIHYVYNSK
jgi:hypothetical protein